MEKLLKYLAEQNKSFDPQDSLSRLIEQTLADTEDELNEDELSFIQAARGAEAFQPSDRRKETDRK